MGLVDLIFDWHNAKENAANAKNRMNGAWAKITCEKFWDTDTSTHTTTMSNDTLDLLEKSESKQFRKYAKLCVTKTKYHNTTLTEWADEDEIGAPRTGTWTETEECKHFHADAVCKNTECWLHPLNKEYFAAKQYYEEMRRAKKNFLANRWFSKDNQK